MESTTLAMRLCSEIKSFTMLKQNTQ